MARSKGGTPQRLHCRNIWISNTRSPLWTKTWDYLTPLRLKQKGFTSMEEREDEKLELITYEPEGDFPRMTFFRFVKDGKRSPRYFAEHRRFNADLPPDLDLNLEALGLVECKAVFAGKDQPGNVALFKQDNFGEEDYLGGPIRGSENDMYTFISHYFTEEGAIDAARDLERLRELLD